MRPTNGKKFLPEEPTPPIPRRRLWLFRFCTAIIIPLVILGGLELGLRWFGYGYPASFFLRYNIDGQGYYVPNDEFGCRFFPPAIAREPTPQRMAVKKSPDTYRIFVFGESAAMGDPDPSYGMGRYLQVLLQERYPEIHFEVICVAMTAIYGLFTWATMKWWAPSAQKRLMDYGRRLWKLSALSSRLRPPGSDNCW